MSPIHVGAALDILPTKPAKPSSQNKEPPGVSDFALRRNYESLKIHEHSFILDASRWRKLNQLKALEWQSVPFHKDQKQNIPQERGIYCFVVQPAAKCLPTLGYLIYVGETGDRSGSHLRRRFGEYLGEAAAVKRSKMFIAFALWKGVVKFNFATIRDKRLKLKKLEMQLNDALVPPFNDDDFSGEFRPAIRAFRR